VLSPFFRSSSRSRRRRKGKKKEEEEEEREEERGRGGDIMSDVLTRVSSVWTELVVSSREGYEDSFKVVRNGSL